MKLQNLITGLFIVFLFTGLFNIMHGLIPLGSLIVLASTVGINLSIFLFNGKEYMVPGKWFDYKWQDYLMYICAILLVGTSLLILL